MRAVPQPQSHEEGSTVSNENNIDLGTALDVEPDNTPAPTFIGHEEGLSMIREWHALERAEKYGSTPAPTSTATSPPPPEDEAKQAALDALARRDERTRLVSAGRALLDEQYAAWGFDSSRMTEDEILAEAGLLAKSEMTDEQKRAREVEDYDRRVLADPALLERELRRKDQERLRAEWLNLDPAVRDRRAADLGLDPAELDAAARADFTRRAGG